MGVNQGLGWPCSLLEKTKDDHLAGVNGPSNNNGCTIMHLENCKATRIPVWDATKTHLPPRSLLLGLANHLTISRRPMGETRVVVRTAAIKRPGAVWLHTALFGVDLIRSGFIGADIGLRPQSVRCGLFSLD